MTSKYTSEHQDFETKGHSAPLPRNLPKLVPWRDAAEWMQVYSGLLPLFNISSGQKETTFFEHQIGLERSLFIIENIWARRASSLPKAIEATLSLAHARLLFLRNKNNNHHSMWSARLTACTAITRLVNNCVDAAQEGYVASSVNSLAKQIDLPRILVDIRHSATHDAQLPEASLLEMAVEQGLQWLHQRYWLRVVDFGEALEKSFLDALKARYRLNLIPKDNFSGLKTFKNHLGSNHPIDLIPHLPHSMAHQERILRILLCHEEGVWKCVEAVKDCLDRMVRNAKIDPIALSALIKDILVGVEDQECKAYAQDYLEYIQNSNNNVSLPEKQKACSLEEWLTDKKETDEKDSIEKRSMMLLERLQKNKSYSSSEPASYRAWSLCPGWTPCPLGLKPCQYQKQS